jgi:hypothetical protein
MPRTYSIDSGHITYIKQASKEMMDITKESLEPFLSDSKIDTNKLIKEKVKYLNVMLKVPCTSMPIRICIYNKNLRKKQCEEEIILGYAPWLITKQVITKLLDEDKYVEFKQFYLVNFNYIKMI